MPAHRPAPGDAQLLALFYRRVIDAYRRRATPDQNAGVAEEAEAIYAELFCPPDIPAPPAAGPSRSPSSLECV